MKKNSVAIVGKGRLAQELLQISRECGIEAAAYPDAEKVAPSTSLVVETIAGDESEKRKILAQLDAQAPACTILSSCLGFSTSLIASWTEKPERVVGFATFYPLKDKKVIELAAGLRTGETSTRDAETFLRSLGKEPVWVKDAAGLILPRMLSLIINEAARSLDEGVALAEEIDVAMRLGTNYPQGPLRWGDEIGLDEVLAVVEGLQRETGEDRYRPAPLLKKMVHAGWTGVASGRGFYAYEGRKAGE